MALKLGEILLGRRLISPAQLEAALAEQRARGGRLGEILVRRGDLRPRDLKAALAEQSRSFVLAAALLVNGGMSAGTPAYTAIQGGAVAVAFRGVAIGAALSLGGAVEVVSPEGDRRRLAPGDPLFEGEIIETAAAAEARVIFADGSMLTVGPSSAVILDRFVYAADPGGMEKTGAAARAVLRKLAGAADYGAPVEGNITAGVRA